MSTSIIDGTVEEVVTGRQRGSITVFKSIRFKLEDGSGRTVTKAVVKQPVSDELKPGARGRFYFFNAFDIRGFHGVRMADGRSIYAFPTNNQKLFLILGLINLAWIVFKVTVDGEIPLLGLALMILAVVGWIFMGKGEKEARQQFDADADLSGKAAVTGA
ncbi:hypothetical protein KK137_10320 [Croceibacterium sp. LX-88]|uniref:Uncharacterized protein n=1 Tax=Croceibacterium selenioxidans TaxID=2838833 RepID=A0ABS5W4U3_9SPHN|nr:hypothetical protein [Croceibacterium selenioxidans]MBT2134729.1 hypothetical protein [Croceibacterium selenioxidans]